MAVPPFWNNDFYYVQVNSTADVAAVIAAIHTAVTAHGWTDESGGGTGPWRTPARADGIFFRVGITRISATRLAYVMYDQAGLLVTAGQIDYRQDIEAAGNLVDIFCGPLYLCVNSLRATNEPWFGCVLDQTPEPMYSPRAIYMHWDGPRTNAGTLTTYTWATIHTMRPCDSGYGQRTSMALLRSVSSAYQRRTLALTALFSPAEFIDSGSTPALFIGRIPQCIAIDSTGLSPGADVTVPIDAGVNATFRTIGISTSNINQLLAFRKS